MQKITPHLWFDKEAKEAAEFYCSIFSAVKLRDLASGGSHSKVTSTQTLGGTPSGDVDIVSFELRGQPFMAISAGPLFKFNPSVSFLVYCETKEEVDKLWGKLSKGGKVLMELASCPFSERYGWLEDKYGLSWQIMKCQGGQKITQKIVPFLMFVGDVAGEAEEAMNFYVSVFKGKGESKLGDVARHQKGMEPDREGTVMYGGFTLLAQEFAAMDSAHKHDFSFNEAVSFIVHCDNQDEIDYYWEKLSAVPESEQCGWLKDKYGVSWQIVPTAMDEMMSKGTKEQIKRLTEAFLKMKKFDIAKLQEAYNQS